MKTMTPKIEQGIPIPASAAGRRTGCIQLLRQLKVGESVLLSMKPQNARNAAQVALGVGKYASRQQGTEIRIWRTAE